MTGAAEHPGKKHVVQFLAHFEITGSNGRHLCLVVEAFGPVFDLDVLSPGAAWEVARKNSGECLLCPRHGDCSRRYVYGNEMLCANVNVMSSGKFLRTDLRREKFLFTNTRFLHQDGDL